MKSKEKRIKIIYLICTLIVVMAFAPSPYEVMQAIGFFEKTQTIGKISLFFTLSPLYPLLITSITLIADFKVDANKIKIISVICLVAGLFYSAILAVLSGPGFEIVLINGIAISIAIAISIFMISPEPEIGVVSASGIFIVLTASVWSLSSAGIAIYHASRIAQNSPFCIAHHSGYSSNQRLLSLMDLRGSKLFTTATGYKDSSRWYFHAVLIVNDNGDKRFYNWSPRSMEYHEVLNEKLLIVPIRNSCITKSGFISSMPFG